MASAFGHGILAFTMKKVGMNAHPVKVTLIAMFCAIVPDLDVIAFKFGIPYEHMFGHRGFSHSFFFAVCLGILMSLIFHRKERVKLAFFYGLVTATHPILDAMTTGGRGIAFLAPFSEERFFLPWRVIQVSPIHISRFFSEWGIAVLKSEFIYIWIPCLVVLGVRYLCLKLVSSNKLM